MSQIAIFRQLNRCENDFKFVLNVKFNFHGAFCMISFFSKIEVQEPEKLWKRRGHTKSVRTIFSNLLWKCEVSPIRIFEFYSLKRCCRFGLVSRLMDAFFFMAWASNFPTRLSASGEFTTWLGESYSRMEIALQL